MSIELWTLAIAGVTSVVCALCGSLLLVNRRAMVSEGLSHAVLPGLVVAFMVFRDYNSPWLIISAAASGMVMVWLTQWLHRTRLVDGDAGLGIVFAGMFSLGILLVSLKLRNTHFHADCIIDGNLALAPLDRLRIMGRDFGPRSFAVMLTMLLLTIAYTLLCYKELKVMLFDPQLAQQFRLKPVLLQWVTLSLISLTTVAAFDVAGSILIVALMIAPPAAAYLLTDRLGSLMVISGILGAISSIIGFYLAMHLDISPTGPMASVAGLVLLIVVAVAPARGLLAKSVRLRRQRQQIKEVLLLDVLRRKSDQGGGVSVNSLPAAIGWSEGEVGTIVQRLRQRNWICSTDSGLGLTEAGEVELGRQLMRV